MRLQIKKTRWRKKALCGLIYIPPVVIASINPKIFITALGFAGGIGCALLLGFLPILMVWVGRYKKKYSQFHCQLPGGKPILVLLLLFVFLEICIELF